MKKLRRKIKQHGIEEGTIRGNQVDSLPEDVLRQVAHNIEILKELEKEHEKERKERKDINEALEAGGSYSMADKLKTLQQRAVEEAKNRAMEQKETVVEFTNTFAAALIPFLREIGCEVKQKANPFGHLITKEYRKRKSLNNKINAKNFRDEIGLETKTEETIPKPVKKKWTGFFED